MTRKELIKMGVSRWLVDKAIQEHEIVIQDGLLKLSPTLAIRLFLDGLKEGKFYQDSLKTDDEFANAYMKLLSNLYLGNIEEAKIYLSIINHRHPNNEYQNVITLYNFLLNGTATDNLRIVYDDDMYIGLKVNLVKKYLYLHQYTIASDILDEILKIDDNIYFQILKRVCDKLLSNTIYIVDEANIKDQVTRENIARMERKMLIDLEQKENPILSPNFNNLVRFDICPDVYKIIVSLINWIDYFRVNYRKISNRDMRAIYGDFDSVIFNLLTSQDFYRLKNVVDDQYKNEETFSIKVQMYKILIDIIMSYNKRNKEFIDREIKNTLSKKNEQSLIERYPFSSISIDAIVDEVEEGKADFSKNYYQVYENFYKNARYKEAKRALQQFKINMASIDVPFNFDYLFKELDILIANENDSLEDKNKANTLMNEAKKMEDKNFNEAISLYLESLKYQSNGNSRVLSKIASLYAKNGEYQKSLSYYQEADKTFLYPNDYITIMELLIKTENYQSVPEYARKYDGYYPDENAYVYYLLSIAYLNEGVYDLADDALNMADAINIENYNVGIPYTREHEILKKLKNKEVVEVYTIDDFVNYDLSDQEKVLLKHVDELKKQDKNTYVSILKSESLNKKNVEDKLAYLLMLIRVFNYKADDALVNDFVGFVELLLNDENVSHEVKEEMSKKLELYKIS